MNERDELRSNAYLDGALPPADRVAFEADLARDPALRAEYDALVAFDAKLRSATEGENRDSAARTERTVRALEQEHVASTQPTARLAAALLGALLLGFTVAELLCVRPDSTSTSPPIPPQPAPRPSITAVLGDVVIARPNEKGGASVTRGAPWQVGDMLSTGEGSAVLAEVPGVVELALGKNTTLTHVADSRYELAFGHAICLRDPSAPTLSISVPGVAAEILVEEGSCELDWAPPINAKKMGPTLLRVRALAGADGTARTRIRDRELQAGEAIGVDVDSLRDDPSTSWDVGWFLELRSARDR